MAASEAGRSTAGFAEFLLESAVCTAALRGFGFPKVPVPFYNGTAWFLPFGGAYYKAKDRLL